MQVMEMPSARPLFYVFVCFKLIFVNRAKKRLSELNFHAYDTTTIVAYSLWKGNSHGLIETRHHSGFDACLIYMFCNVFFMF